jgi:AAA ATPase domain
VLEALADLCRQHPTLLDGLDDAFRREIERALRGGDLAWSGEGAHQRLFVSVAELLRLAAGGGGAVLTIDDLHEADEGSLRLLHYLARAGTRERVLLVVGTRRFRRTAGSAGCATASCAGGRRWTWCWPAATRRYGGLARPAPRRPRRGAPRPRGPGVVGRPARADRRPRPGVGTGDAWRMPVRRLPAACPPGTEKVLRRVAVAGTAVDTDEFVALSGTDEETAFAVLDAALAAGLLEPAEVGYRFHTGRIRERLLADLPPHRLQ